MRFLIKSGKRGLLPFLLCLSFLVFPGLAGAWNSGASNGVFLSSNAAQSQATYIVQFGTKIQGKIDKIFLTFPSGTNVDKAVLGRTVINDKIHEDDGKDPDDNKLYRKSSNTLLVDLRQSRHVWPGSIVLIELFNLINPPGGNHVLNMTIQDHRGHARETISPPLAFSISASAGGAGDITKVTAGTGLTGGGTSGDVTLGVAVPFQLPQSCSSGKCPNGTEGRGPVLLTT